MSFAGTVTTTPKSTATLISTCTIAISDIQFGLITPATGSPNKYLKPNMNVLCSKGIAYSIALSFGNNVTDKFFINNSRHLIGINPSNKDVLQYNICVDSGGSTCNTVWGGAGVGSTIGGTGTGENRTINYTATVQQAAFIIPDNYTDTLTATINF